MLRIIRGAESASGEQKLYREASALWSSRIQRMTVPGLPLFVLEDSESGELLGAIWDDPNPQNPLNEVFPEGVTCFLCAVHERVEGRGWGKRLAECYLAAVDRDGLLIMNTPLSPGGEGILRAMGFVDSGSTAYMWVRKKDLPTPDEARRADLALEEALAKAQKRKKFLEEEEEALREGRAMPVKRRNLTKEEWDEIFGDL